MLTRDRPGFVAVAADCFLRQDYPNRELIVVDDGRRPALDALPEDPRIRYVRLEQPASSLGAKRNRSVELAAGPLLAHWDDDDWHAPWRLSHQVAGMLASGAELSGAAQVLFAAPRAGRAWRYVHPGLGRPWLAGGTLCYTRELWRAGRFAEVDAGEDGLFAWTHRSRRVHRPADPRMVVAMIHAGNASPKVTTDRGWKPHDLDALRVLLGTDWQRCVEAANPVVQPVAPVLVSCIMPTCNRRRFVPQALRSFFAQDYPDKELIVVDDGSDPVRDLIADHASIRYVRSAGRSSIGTKRNLACELARGDVIVQWDDDDWHGPTRLTYQLADILSGHADLTALAHVLYLDVAGMQFWASRRDLHERMYLKAVHGGTLAFRRALLEALRRVPGRLARRGRDVHGTRARARRPAHAAAEPGLVRLHPARGQLLALRLRHLRRSSRVDAGRSARLLHGGRPRVLPLAARHPPAGRDR